jgi:hypothetical protein
MNIAMTVILIEKDGQIYEKQVKTIMDKLYSVCGYRTNKDFEKLHEWKFDENVYEIYGKKNGKKDKENNFVLPNKSMNEKYYGTLCVIKKNGSITLDEWNIFYMSFTYDSTQLYETESDTGIDEDFNINEKNEKNKQYKFENELNNLNHDLISVSDSNHELELTYEEYEEEP